MAGIKLSTLVRRLRREGPSGDGTDADLLARFARGRDDSAFELLVWRHGAMVLGACRRVLGHTEDAEDAFQATFLVLARKAGSVSVGASLPSWLHRVALRVATRLAKSRRTILPLTVDPPGSMGVASVERAEELAALDEEIDHLPDRCRRAVVLCYLEGLTATEAGRQLGCPTGTVESRLATARKLLRDRLTRRGVTLPVGVLAVMSGQGVLAPEAVARVVRAAVAFAREGAATAVGVVGQTSVKLAQRALTMGRTQWWAGAMVITTAVAISTGVVWADRDQPAAVAEDPPPAKPAEVVASPPTAPPPKTKDAPVAPVEAWPLARELTHDGRAFVGASPDGQSLFLQFGNGIVRLNIANLLSPIDYSSGVIESRTPISSTAFSPDGKLAATAESENGVKLRDLAQKTVKEAIWPKAGVNAREVAFTPDGSRLVVLCWRLPPDTGMPYPPVRQHELLTLPRSRNALRDTTNRTDFQLSVWDLATRKELDWPANPEVREALSRATRMELVAGGRFILAITDLEKETSNEGYWLTLIDTTTGAVGKVATFRKPGYLPVVADVGVSPDGLGMVAVYAGEVMILDPTTGRERLKLGSLRRVVAAVAYSPDGKLVAAASSASVITNNLAAPAEIVIWDAITGKELARLIDKEINRDYSLIRFSPDSSYLVAQDSKELTIWGRPPEPEPVKPTPVVKAPPAAVAAAGVPDRFQSLIRDLSADGVPDSRRVEAIFVAALGRFPSEIEARALAAQIASQADKAAALRGLLATLVDTNEFQAHAAAIQRMAKPTPPAGVSPPNPPHRFGPGQPGPPPPRHGGNRGSRGSRPHSETMTGEPPDGVPGSGAGVEADRHR